MPRLGTHRASTLHERFADLNAASSRDALALAQAGKKLRCWTRMCAPLWTFIRVYCWNGQWRRGTAGLVTAAFAAYAVFVRYAKLWEHRRQPPLTPPPHS